MAKLKILLAEDHFNVVFVINEYLRKEFGNTVELTHFFDSWDALKFAIAKKPKLCIFDVDMKIAVVPAKEFSALQKKTFVSIYKYPPNRRGGSICYR